MPTMIPDAGDSLKTGMALYKPTGAWISRNARRLEKLAGLIVERAQPDSALQFDLSGVSKLDTLGVMVIENIRTALKLKNTDLQLVNITQTQAILLDEIASRNIFVKPAAQEPLHLINLLADLGGKIRNMLQDFFSMVAFLGETMRGIGRLVTMKSRFRVPAVINQIERVGLRGVPIIMLISFLVGGILAQQMILQLSKYGATLLVVYTLAVLMFREVGLLLAAIMVAGRSGSAITAELGSMKMREEIDAMNVMGLNPMEVLIIPRVMALVVSLPILTFLAAIAGVFGGALVAWGYGGITPVTFLDQLRDSMTMNTFLVGLVKAPFMALMIGMTACIEGMKVKGSADSLGRQTTSSVVKSIFIVIVADGIFAIFFASINF